MATILGPDGQPLSQEIASIERDPHRTFFGGIQLPDSDDTLRTRGGGKGLKIYRELKRDAHAGAVLAKRKLAVTSRPWSVLPASDRRVDKKAADLVEGALKHLRFNSLCKRLLDATLMGFAVAEVMWEVRDGFLLPKAIKARDQRRFLFGVDDGLRLLTRDNMSTGEVMPERKFIVHRRGADDDTPYGDPLGSMLFWPVLFKRKGITFWLTFADKFGSPTALGKYPSSAGDPEQKKLLAALRAIAQDAGVIVPEGMSIELLEAARSGSVDTYEKLVRYMDEQISKAVLGETMSTTASASGLGSNQAGVHDGVRMEVAKDDADELDETLNESLVRWIVEYNMPAAQMPQLQRDFTTDDSDSINTFTIGVQRLVSLGLRIPTDWVHERFDIPRASDGEETLSLPQQVEGEGQQAAAGDAPGADIEFADGQPLARALRGDAVRQREQHLVAQQAITEGAEALASQWQSLMRKPVEELMELLDSTGDLVEFRERMHQLLERKPDATTVETIARATFSGHVMGRAMAPKKPGLLTRVKQALKRG